jgi:hypothetical protein
MALLKREEILKAEDLPTETVKIPEWGGDVLVRGLTGAEREKLEGQITKDSEEDAIRARLVSMVCLGEDGKPLFTEADVAALKDKSAVALSRVFAVAQRLSGLGMAAAEDLRKNS